MERFERALMQLRDLSVVEEVISYYRVEGDAKK